MNASPRRGYVVTSILLVIGLVCWRTWARSLAGAEPEKRPPDFVAVRYGPHERHVLDLWKAIPRSGKDGPTPLVIFFHGGGFRGGDKSSVPGRLVTDCLAAGISVASANYRLSQSAPFPAPMLDGARAIQFLRSRASELGLDPSRFAASGSSAARALRFGSGFMTTWPIRPAATRSRQSSRVRCLGVDGAQTSYDPRYIKTLIGGRAHEHSALRPFFGIKSDSDLTSPATIKLYEDASPLNHASTDDPPVVLFYKEPDKPLPPSAKPGSGIHHPRFGAALKGKLDKLGVECILHHEDEYPSEADPDEAEYRDMVDFFIGRLREKTN